MTFRNKKVVRTVQIILGLALILFGLNTFLQFMPAMQFNEVGSAYLGALFNTGYIFPIIGVVWILAGLLFVFNKCSPFAAVLIFPISVNILLFHIALDFTGWTFGLLIFLLNLELIYAHWDSYKPMCR